MLYRLDTDTHTYVMYPLKWFPGWARRLLAFSRTCKFDSSEEIVCTCRPSRWPKLLQRLCRNLSFQVSRNLSFQVSWNKNFRYIFLYWGLFGLSTYIFLFLDELATFLIQINFFVFQRYCKLIQQLRGSWFILNP